MGRFLGALFQRGADPAGMIDDFERDGESDAADAFDAGMVEEHAKLSPEEAAAAFMKEILADPEEWIANTHESALELAGGQKNAFYRKLLEAWGRGYQSVAAGIIEESRKAEADLEEDG